MGGLRNSDCSLRSNDGVDCIGGVVDESVCGLSLTSLERDVVISLTGAIGVDVTGFTVVSAASSSGLPGLVARTGSCLAKGVGLGAGVVLAITLRSIAIAGGLCPKAAAPRRLS